ncbi:gas vesicle protein [Clostridium beijerinckii]|uniref:hypothetical protein n=1 Tax=Clostridium beijerinckii TaxID=1520 RepID=UPI00156E3165|nr:hypothetical protein [Clostridium beijerinckii]NRT32461.1 gas vesicle protein [Clostridium beijerinckii]NRT48111.1 gas vesicle protein [Clostridium beijerinckii]NRZ23592.1 gas vesicle protein [Clostridium beijerinckii]
MHVLFGALLFGCLVELILLLIKPKWATLGRELPNKKKSIKNLVIVIIAFLLLFAFTSGKSTNSTVQTNASTNKVKEVPTKEDTVNQTENNELTKKEENDKSNFLIDSEPNTSAAVDELISRGKNDSKNATKDDIKIAIKFINDNYNKYWVDNETMHKTMYYGALLEYSNQSKDIKELGLDSEQVVKYVYRKADKIEDASTQSNLEQIKKSLDKIPTSLK